MWMDTIENLAATTHKGTGIITLGSIILWGTVLPAPYCKDKCKLYVQCVFIPCHILSETERLKVYEWLSGRGMFATVIFIS